MFTNKEQRKRWRENSNSYLGNKGRYTKEEIQMIMRHDISDRELSQKICRSIQAIHTKRCKIKNKY